MGMLEEIKASGEGWAQAVEAGSACAWPWEGTLFLGSGSSYYLARIAAWLARTQGHQAQALPSGEALLHPQVAAGARHLVGISRSGQTTELLRAVQALRLPAFLLTTRDPGERAGFVQRVVLDRAREEAIVQTRSFTSALVFFLTAFLGKGATAGLPRRFAEAEGKLWEAALSWPRAKRYFVLGTGPAWGLAQEVALKLKETALVQVEAFHTLEFRHGPMSMVDEEAAVFLLLPMEDGGLERAVGQEMATLGAKVVEVAYRLPEMPLALVPFQFLAYQLAKERGLDPERPRNLTYAVQL
ncbi:SIS domain-containing protein [Thermus tenuipuniceus]|uniref:SIS domain-containing protein n=1 Tax=Thermus tenuipuniceus TaxID=2078690 RepID=UPI000CFA3436|nr:SIS domain-containing protein [Thermus tenuipuniceus]